MLADGGVSRAISCRALKWLRMGAELQQIIMDASVMRENLEEGAAVSSIILKGTTRRNAHYRH
jgi:hypothetical protein